MKQIARSRNMTLQDMVSQIDDRRGRGNLSSTIRLFVLASVRAQDNAARPAEGDKNR